MTPDYASLVTCDREKLVAEIRAMCYIRPEFIEKAISAAEAPTIPPPLAGEGGEAFVKDQDLAAHLIMNVMQECRHRLGYLKDGAPTLYAKAIAGLDLYVDLRDGTAPPTLAPSQGTAGTDDSRNAARYRWLRKTYGERLLEFLWAWTFVECASEYIEQRFDQEIDAEMRDKGAALASPAVRDERVPDEPRQPNPQEDSFTLSDAEKLTERYWKIMDERYGDEASERPNAVTVMHDALLQTFGTHQKVAAAGDET